MIMSAAGAERLAGQYGVSAGVDATGVLAWSAKRAMARLYHSDLAGLAWARYEKVVALASVPCVDGQWPGAGVEGRLDNGPEPNMREAYAFFQHGAARPEGGSVAGWGARGGVGLRHACLTACLLAAPAPSLCSLFLPCVSSGLLALSIAVCTARSSQH